MQLDGFLNRYREYYTDEFIERFSAADKGIDKLHILDDEARRLGYPLYLIIDEYDNFTNVVLNEKATKYIVPSPTQAASTVMPSKL